MTAKTVPAPPRPSRTPASAGATSTLRLSIQPATTFAAVSSSGVRASDGRSTACAGRVTVTAVAATAASAYAANGGPSASRTAAVAPMAAA